MILTNDMYEGLSTLERWYHKLKHQIIDIAGVIGTGSWQLIQLFLDRNNLEPIEVMYLSYDQKQVLELASKRYHAFYISNIIYNYTRHVDFNSLPVLNSQSDGVIQYQWKKDVRKKINKNYKIMIVFDSVLLSEDTLRDLASFGLPIILLRDPILLPSPDTYTFFREPNITLRELHPELSRNPIVHFANMVLNGTKLKYGNYDIVSVIPRKQMNLYNLKSADMVLTMSDRLRDNINSTYREKILKQKTTKNIVGEKVIVMNNMYGHRLVNSDEKNIKIYLTRGMIGYLTKCNSHAVHTKYVPIEFRPEFYHEVFDNLVMDRHYLNKFTSPSKQIIPDEIIKLEYAYALTVPLARLSHWDKVTIVVDIDEEQDPGLQIRLLYSAIASARKSVTIIL